MCCCCGGKVCMLCTCVIVVVVVIGLLFGFGVFTHGFHKLKDSIHLSCDPVAVSGGTINTTAGFNGTPAVSRFSSHRRPFLGFDSSPISPSPHF